VKKDKNDWLETEPKNFSEEEKLRKILAWLAARGELPADIGFLTSFAGLIRSGERKLRVGRVDEI
jgi:hypothetical protein